MKTANEIINAIETKKETERKEIIDWAIKLIDDASEEMMTHLKTSCMLPVESGLSHQIHFAISQPEVKELLETNGFKVVEESLYKWFLKTI